MHFQRYGLSRSGAPYSGLFFLSVGRVVYDLRRGQIKTWNGLHTHGPTGKGIATVLGSDNNETGGLSPGI